MSNNARAPQRHTVAMTVLVEAEGRDYGDATNVAWKALLQVVAADEHAEEIRPTEVVVHTYQGYPRSATIVEIVPTYSAVRAGVLMVMPAAAITLRT